MASRCSSLLLNVNDLLSLERVEKQRVEFKKAWHSKKEGETYWQVVHTICAFANDFYNDNGGYIIIGVEEKENWEDHPNDRQIILPPIGVPPKNIERIQKEIIGACRGNIEPEYFPILSSELVEFKGVKRRVLVIWASASDDRPHACRESEKGCHHYYIRRATETVEATRDEKRQLLFLHRKIPFDDRRALESGTGRQMTEGDINFDLVKKFLTDVKSQLLEGNKDKPPIYFYERLKIVRVIGDTKVGHELVKLFAPRNVALLFFHTDPHDFFSGAKTEIAIYSHDDDSQEQVLTGPIDQQIEKILNFILDKTKEQGNQEFVAYPTSALREAIVNAFHHRGYEECHSNPIKIHIKPNFIDVISYPGPDASLKLDDFKEGGEVPPVPSRNRRIAEFLKERKLAEGRFTGVHTIYKTMKKNKNPQPSFHFNASYFCVRLPGHPKYIAHSVLQEVDNLCSKGEKDDAINFLKGCLDEHLHKAEYSFAGYEMVLSRLIALHDNNMEHANLEPYKHLISTKLQQQIPLKIELSKWCSEESIKDISIGVRIVKDLVETDASSEDLAAVISKAANLCKNKDEKAVQNAHKLFEAMGEITQTNASVAFEFANCKLQLYKITANTPALQASLVPFLEEADEYVYKAIQLTPKDCKVHLANHYRLLGYIHSQLARINKSTKERAQDHLTKAREFNPEIRINTFYILPELRSSFRLPGSIQNPNKYSQE